MYIRPYSQGRDYLTIDEGNTPTNRLMMIENMDVCTVCNQDIQPLSNDEVFQIFPPPPSDDFLDMKKLEETIGQGKVKLQGIENLWRLKELPIIEEALNSEDEEDSQPEIVDAETKQPIGAANKDKGGGTRGVLRRPTAGRKVKSVVRQPSIEKDLEDELPDLKDSSGDSYSEDMNEQANTKPSRKGNQKLSVVRNGGRGEKKDENRKSILSDTSAMESSRLKRSTTKKMKVMASADEKQIAAMLSENELPDLNTNDTKNAEPTITAAWYIINPKTLKWRVWEHLIAFILVTPPF